jgi:hypothetical protein
VPPMIDIETTSGFMQTHALNAYANPDGGYG